MPNRYHYDPGEPYDPPPYRRRRQRFGAADDGWAAADEDDFYDDDVEIEDLAPGYVDHEHDRRWTDDDESDWTPPPYGRRGRERGYPDEPRRSYDRKGHMERRTRYAGRSPYGDNRTYHRDRASRGEYGTYTDKPKRTSARTDSPAAYDAFLGLGSRGIPFWQILMVVILAIAALFAMGLACASIFYLL